MPFMFRLLCLMATFAIISLSAQAETLDLSKDELTPQTYNPAQILLTANKLIALGPQAAYASLLQYANSPASFRDHINHDYYTAWLCLLIYDPKPNEGLPIPWFGGPQFPSIENHRYDKVNAYLPGWPRFPLAESKDVPFLVVFSYTLAGKSEPGADYLNRCPSFGIFRTKPYSVPTYGQAQDALTALVSSSEWKALSWEKYPHQMYSDMELPFLQGQVDRIKR